MTEKGVSVVAYLNVTSNKQTETMEERDLTPQESLRVIQNMMDQTRRNIEHRSSRPCLIWGYTATAISLLVFFLYPHWGNDANFLWLAIPVVGGLLSWFFLKKGNRRHIPKTQMDKLLDVVWGVMGTNVILLGFIPMQGEILSIVLILIGAATAITAFGADVELLKYSSIFGMTMGYALMILSLPIALKVLIFAITFFLMHCIPGHIMAFQIKRNTHA
ncbi:hypothetical protein [Porphyromonas crevioricanis]|nr:hypothetical protein [Porphyromonas crevioricanis]